MDHNYASQYYDYTYTYIYTHTYRACSCISHAAKMDHNYASPVHMGADDMSNIDIRCATLTFSPFKAECHNDGMSACLCDVLCVGVCVKIYGYTYIDIHIHTYI